MSKSFFSGLGFALSVVAALFLAACQDGSKQNLASQHDQKQESTVVLLTWADDYIDPEVIKQFETSSGIRVQFEHFESIEEMKGKLSSQPSRYDVVVVDDVTLAELIETKMFLPVERQKLPNFKNLDDRYVNQPFDPGNRYSVPYIWGTNLIAYRNDMIENPDLSWNLLWDENLKGKVVMLESEADLYSVALLSMGYSVNSQDEEELSRCTAKLIDQARKSEATYQDLFAAMDLLISGQAWASLMYSGDAAVLAEEDPKISFFIPKEGAPLWMDSFAVSRDARNVAEAHRFLDYLLGAEVAAQNANFLWGGSPNAAAAQYIDPDLQNDETINPPKAILEKCDFYASPSARRNAIMNQGLKQILDVARASSNAPQSGAAFAADTEPEEEETD